MKHSEHIQALFGKFLDDTITNEEMQVLFDHFHMDKDKDALLRIIRNQLDNHEPIVQNHMPLYNRMTDKVQHRLRNAIQASPEGRRQTPIRKLAVRISIAASILFVVGIGSMLLYNNYSGTEQALHTTAPDIEPGGNRATLTLADGRTLVLSEDKEGIIIGDALTYDDGTTLDDTDMHNVEYATLTTPNGGQYQVTLPDGSKVWLNAASSLKYPTRFARSERKVQLTGEAYFDVVHHEKQPFIVVSNNQRVQVLGTQFNVNTYDNEPVMTTTLVQGAVKVFNDVSGYSVTIAPGEQAVMHGNTVNVEQVDVAEYTAWKDGYFHFKATDLKNIMRQMERWYDVDVDYSTLPDRKLYARIDRNKTLSTVLYMFESTSELKFKIEGRRLSIVK